MTTTPSASPARELGPPAKAGMVGNFVARELPYVVMLVLALVGIAYTDLLPMRSEWYWQILAVVFGIICIITEWPRCPSDPKERMRLIVTQVLHWGAFLLAMRLLFLPVMQKNLDAEITGLILVYVLALSTFLAGIYINWRLCVVGGFLGIGVLAVAFVDQASALLTVLAVVVVAAAWLWNHFRSGLAKT
jgi:hypothetical protein